VYPIRYIYCVYLLKKTEEFDRWLAKLRDLRAQALIIKRLVRVGNGNLSDHKAVGDGVSEIRIDYGPGYRLYFTKKSGLVILLLIGGDKTSQAKDIKKAKHLLKEYGE